MNKLKILVATIAAVVVFLAIALLGEMTYSGKLEKRIQILEFNQQQILNVLSMTSSK